MVACAGNAELDGTHLDHYMSFPLCGRCYAAWDVMFLRMRSSVSPLKWTEMCTVGGCDPEIWDYIDERTGWPLGWEVDPYVGLPYAYINMMDPKRGLNTLQIAPEYDDRIFHMRKRSDEAAPWRKINARLRQEAVARGAKIDSMMGIENAVFDDEEDDEFGPHGDDVVQHKQVAKEKAKKVKKVDLDDPDLWD